MSTDYPPDPAYDRPGAFRQVDSRSAVGLSLLESFRDCWSRGDRISVEEFVRKHQGTDTAVTDDEVLLDVVFAEYVAREELGEQPTLDEYVRRFPKLGDRLTRLLSLDEAIRDLPELGASAETANPQAADTLAAPRRPTELPDETASRIGKYLIVGELGSGGQGKVYRAVHPSLAREVVVKLSHVKGDIPAHLRDELVREGRMLAELDHPHLARVHDFDFHNGEPFLVMEYFPGANLEQYARQAKLPPERIATLTAKIARALGAVHKKGIVHRDLKPRNIMIDSASEPRLIDFGLALADTPWRTPDFRSEQVVGTLAYMAPEQAVGGSDRVGPAADLFALGGVLYFLLTGKAPFKGRGFDDTLAKVVANDHDRAALEKATAPEKLKAICRKLLATEPTDRYASADEAAAALERFAAPPKGRWLPITAAAGGLVAAALIAIGASGIGRHEDPKPQPLAQAPPEKKNGPVIVSRGMSLTAIPEITVDVLNRKTKVFREIMQGIENGDVYKVRIKVPAGVHVSLFHGTAGKFEHEVDIEPKDLATTVDYPNSAGKGIQASGPAGTEMYLAIARKSGPVTAAELGDLADPKLPILPVGSMLRLKTDEVKPVNLSRDIVDIGPNPEEVVRQRLEALRLALIAKGFDGFDGFAFAHVE